MKKVFFVNLATACTAFFSLNSAFAEPPVLVPAPVEKLFIPQGFDDNDNVEVVVHGHFPDSCYKTGSATVLRDPASKDIQITVTAYRYQDTNCMKMRVPYILPVKVGTLEKGNYRVIAANHTAPLSVGMRNAETPDDYLYAPVEDAYVDIDDSETNQYLVLMGSYPKTFIGCVILKDVRTTVTSDDIIVVQPIMEFLQNDEECAARGWKSKFSYREKLSQHITAGDKLLHVRVLNGNSFNKLEFISK